MTTTVPQGIIQRAEVADTSEAQAAVKKDVCDFVAGRIGEMLQLLCVSISPETLDIETLIAKIQDEVAKHFPTPFALPLRKNEAEFVPDAKRRASSEITLGQGLGNGSEFFKYPLTQRYKWVLEVLKNMDCDLTDAYCLMPASVSVSEELGPGDCSYVAVVVPSLGRTILVKNAIANRTFVIYDTDEPEKYAEMSRPELRQLINERRAGSLVYSKKEPWMQKIEKLLTESPVKDADIVIQAAGEKRNKAYYENPSYVRADLGAICKALGLDSVFSINTRNSANEQTFRCSNGDLMLASSYFVACSRIYACSPSEALNRLLTVAGYTIRDQQYYCCLENLSEDFESFLIAARELSKDDISLSNLSSNKLRSLNILCSNGERVNGRVWVFEAARIFKQSPAILVDRMLKMLGVKPCLDLDEEYFKGKNNKKTIFKDLSELLLAVQAKHPEVTDWQSIRDKHARTVEFTATNGEVLNGRSYIYKASIMLGLVGSLRAAGSKGIFDLSRNNLISIANS